MTLRLVVATANPSKAAEIVSILSDVGVVELVPRPEDVPEVEETGSTFEENSRLKAMALFEATGLAAVADDSGLVVEALGGRPGVRSARFAGEAATDEQNTTELLRQMAGAIDRRARFVTVTTFVSDEGVETQTRGEVIGTIIEAPRGTGGFGYDPVFAPVDGDGRTFAELSPEEKHAVSHRGRALRALAERLGDLGILAR